jgi:hypothetical protein
MPHTAVLLQTGWTQLPRFVLITGDCLVRQRSFIIWEVKGLSRSVNEYVPGACNIGRAEIHKRRQLAWLSAAGGMILWIGLVLFEVAGPWRLILFVPAFLAAMGFLQAAWHFCAKFGLGGVFNFGPNVGKTDTVEQAEYRRRDRRTAMAIIGLSAIIGVAIALLAYLSPF